MACIQEREAGKGRAVAPEVSQDSRAGELAKGGGKRAEDERERKKERKERKKEGQVIGK